MRIDGHIHTGLEQRNYRDNPKANQQAVMKGLREAGMDGGVIFSVDPLQFSDWTFERRLKDVMDTCEGEKNLFPFFWINPMEEDALSQVDRAVTAGIDGFKMICSNYYPYDQQALDVCERIAQHDKPVLFHSGVSWDGLNSGNHNRPDNFEALIEIPHLRFALAHVSWPWCDECIAVYGKFNNAYFRRPDRSCEMFIDVTPGTPRMWREEVFRHMFGSEYEMRYNILFGTDCNTVKYNSDWTKKWVELDESIYDKYVEENVEDFKDHVFCKNILRFMGKSDEKPNKKIPMVGEF